MSPSAIEIMEKCHIFVTAPYRKSEEHLLTCAALQPQVEYLLKKLCMAMSVELNCVELEDFISQDSIQQNGFSVWAFLQMMNSGKLTRGLTEETVSMAIEEVYREIVGDVLKEVGGVRKARLQ